MLPIVKEKERSKDPVLAKDTKRNFTPSESAKWALMLIQRTQELQDILPPVQYLFS